MENKKTEVDIILPNYNSADFIDKTIQGVLNQSYKKWRLILVDDFSNIKTRKKIKKYEKFKKVKIFWLKRNRGAAFCRNYGIKNSNSKYIAFLDSDDVWMKDKLDKQIKYMKKNNYQFTYTNYKTFGLKEKNILPPKTTSFSGFIKNTSIATSTMIVTRKISKGIKFTDTEICEDYFFKCQILKKVDYAYCLLESLTRYRIRKNSLQGNKIRNCYWIWYINKNYNQFNFFENMMSLLCISLNSLRKYGFK